MRVDVLEYYSEDSWKMMKAEASKHETPCLVVDLNRIREKYAELGEYFPFAKIYYAVKANPAVEVLETRLRGRATESEEQILLRLAKAKEELSHWRDYDYLVINDDLETAVADFAALIRAFRLKSSRMNGGRFDD